jgi:NADH dehydrogenase FAD-containing subunit
VVFHGRLVEGDFFRVVGHGALFSAGDLAAISRATA